MTTPGPIPRFFLHVSGNDHNVPAISLRSLIRRSPASLGCCPGCGRDVRADASALAYRGGFYHVVCALWHRESRGRALAAAR